MSLEEKFKFSFKQINFWSIHELYTAMRVVQGEMYPEGEIELINEKGEKWSINSRDEDNLFRLFNKPGIEYTAVVRGGKTDWYQSIFEKYADYRKYFLIGLENEGID